MIARMTTPKTPLLQVENLITHLPTPRGTVKAVDGVSFTINKGETLALVGESGSGKSMLCRTIMGLAPKSAFIPGRSRIIFENADLLDLSERRLNKIRGRRLAMVFQDPMSSLNPVLKIGLQIMEPLQRHLGLSKRDARDRALELMKAVGLPSPDLRFKQHPHQLSGGQRQRASLAMALSCKPSLLIADEPTTSLDATIQAEILELLAGLQREAGLAMILVTHDLTIAASLAKRTAIMRGGKIIEQGRTNDLFTRARRPYTRMLLDAAARLHRSDPLNNRKQSGKYAAPQSPAGRQTVLEVKDLTVEYRLSADKRLKAAAGINFCIAEGETLGLVGESGCGKTSTARAVMLAPPPTSGRVLLQGRDLTSMSPRELRSLRPRFQMIFQSSALSLNPRRKVGASVSMPLKVNVTGRMSRLDLERSVDEMFCQVGLDRNAAARIPSQFSGGQCQRLQIARALIADPVLLVCDEPVSSLDARVRDQIISLLRDLKKKRSLTMLFISHDLASVRSICDRLMVMYSGRICESGNAEDIFRRPRHPYTRALLRASLNPVPYDRDNPGAGLITGEPHSTLDPPKGCTFQARCPEAEKRCRDITPQLLEIEEASFVACHLARHFL